MKVSKSVRACHNQDGAVLLDVAEGKIYGLNPVASRIVELIEEGRSEQQIAFVISQEFSAELSVVLKDVQRLLKELARYKLLVKNGQPEGRA
jgi:hypothetical protein